MAGETHLLRVAMPETRWVCARAGLNPLVRLASLFLRHRADTGRSRWMGFKFAIAPGHVASWTRRSMLQSPLPAIEHLVSLVCPVVPKLCGWDSSDRTIGWQAP